MEMTQKKSHLSTSIFSQDTAYCYDETEGLNLGYNQRKKLVENSKIFDFSIAPHFKDNGRDQNILSTGKDTEKDGNLSFTANDNDSRTNIRVDQNENTRVKNINIGIRNASHSPKKLRGCQKVKSLSKIVQTHENSEINDKNFVSCNCPGNNLSNVKSKENLHGENNPLKSESRPCEKLYMLSKIESQNNSNIGTSKNFKTQSPVNKKGMNNRAAKKNGKSSCIINQNKRSNNYKPSQNTPSVSNNNCQKKRNTKGEKRPSSLVSTFYHPPENKQKQEKMEFSRKRPRPCKSNSSIPLAKRRKNLFGKVMLSDNEWVSL